MVGFETGKVPFVAWAGFYPTTRKFYVIQVDENGKVVITSTDITTILSRIGVNTDEADMADSLFAGQEAIWDNVHSYVGLLVGDKDNLETGETTVKSRLEKKYKVIVLDDDDIDSGNADLDIFDIIFVCASAATMANLNELTVLGVPLFTCNPETALTIFRIGDDSGGSGTSWDTGTGQTQINIVDITHQIFIDQSVGNFTVYSSAGEVNWIRSSDLVAGAIELAEYPGDNTKSTVVVLPYDIVDEDGIEAPMPRVFFGAHEPDKWNTATETIFYNIVDWLMHQGRREVQVQGLGKINTIVNMLGKSKFGSSEDVFDYLVTGTTNSSPFETIASNPSGSVLERLQALTGADADTETSVLNIYSGEQTVFEIVKTTRFTLEGASMSMEGSTPVTTGAVITVRFYVKVNGTYVKLEERTYTKDTDPDGITIIDSSFSATGSIKVTAQSDNASDTATTIPYQYVTRDME